MSFPQRPSSQREYDSNVALVREANARGRRYDLVFYGDSIVSFMRKDRRRVWDKVWRGYRTTPLAVIGTNLQEMSYRIIKGGEFLTSQPKVIVVMCGYINLRWRKDDPTPMMDYLVAWLRANSPSSKIVLMALLDNKHVGDKVRRVNPRYRAIASKHGALWVDCFAAFSPLDRRQTDDGTHPQPEGQRRILECLKREVQQYM